MDIRDEVRAKRNDILIANRTIGRLESALLDLGMSASDIHNVIIGTRGTAKVEELVGGTEQDSGTEAGGDPSGSTSDPKSGLSSKSSGEEGPDEPDPTTVPVGQDPADK